MAFATLMVVPLSLMLSMPVNAKPTLEERADDDWYFNIALFGVSQSKGGKVDSRGLNIGGALGARLSPTLAIEAIIQGLLAGGGLFRRVELLSCGCQLGIFAKSIHTWVARASSLRK